MKHKFNAFIVSLLFISSFGVVSAASGACSGHGGVSCSAGPDSDGSVICEDGWRNSSVSYASMVKCAGYNVQEATASAPVTQPVIVPAVTTKPIERPVVTPTPAVPVSKSVEQKIVAPKPVINTAKKAETKPKPVQAKATTTQKTKLATSTPSATTTVAKVKPEVRNIPTLPSTANDTAIKAIFKKLKFW